MDLPSDIKSQLRQRARITREKTTLEKRDRADEVIAEHMLASTEFAQADIVFAYHSVGSEVDTEEILDAALRAGKTVALPRSLAQHQLTWHRVSDWEGLVPGVFGIPEPPDDSATLIDPTRDAGMQSLALIPGLLFDRRGYRLGFGGGYYDVFLATFPGVSVGLARSGQLVESLSALGATEPHDMRLDAIVTENEQLKF